MGDPAVTADRPGVADANSAGVTADRPGVADANRAGVADAGARSGHVLEVRSLRASVGGREILSGVDLVVRSYEVHALMGPNGSGKSTLAHVLMGRSGYEVTGGSVTLDGIDLLGLPTWKRARAGLFLAMQNPIEVPGVHIAAALEAAAGGGGQSGSGMLAREAGGGQSGSGMLAREAGVLGIDTPLLERPLNVDLSGGERKRSETLQLAMLRPAIAVLDEIDTGLDIDGLRVVAGRIREEVAGSGLGVLAITHFARLLDVLVPDAVHVLVGGRVVASGGPELASSLEQSGYESLGDAI